MNKYALVAQGIHLEGEHVNVCVSATSSLGVSNQIFSVEITLDRQDSYSLAQYEALAIKKAATLIRHMATELDVTA